MVGLPRQPHPSDWSVELRRRTLQRSAPVGQILILGPEKRHRFSPHQLLSLQILRALASDLESTVEEPFWFGLGFVKMRLSPTHVLNFWPDNREELVDESPELHTHRYRFCSEVLRGKLVSTVYETGRVNSTEEIPQEYQNPAPGWPRTYSHVMETVTCSPDGTESPERPVLGYCTPLRLQTNEHIAGTSYNIWKETFHRTVAVEPTITLLTRPRVRETDVATVLRPTHRPAVCAFADSSKRDPWRLIESVLAAPMGYHTKPLPKGTVGEASGILEEVLEFMDAVSPDRGVRNPVLELCELSDTVGSIEAYLKRYFPGLTLQDLTEMARATRESFERGERG